MERQRFNSKELAILTLLRRIHPRAITTNQIAENIRISWNTADKTLDRLFQRGYVERGESPGGLTYWKLVDD